MPLTESLQQHLGQFKTAPFLFIGSGMSRRYLGLEGWDALLRRFAVPLPADYGFYLSKANSDLPQVASLLAEDFHEVWWKSGTYADNRTVYVNDATQRDSPFKIEICHYLKGIDLACKDELLQEVNGLREAVVDGIITTNWDLFLENVFPDFEVFRGQDKLLFSNPQSIAEIYKIHGCCTLPNSVVLTKEDYRVFGERNPYLASKLLTLFIEHPIIFLGYSLSDGNVISILTAITRCLRTDSLGILKNRLLFVQRLKSGETESISTSVLSLEGAILPITLVKTDSFGSVYKAMKTVRRKFPAKLLRQLKSHIYELVQGNDPKDQLHVMDIEAETDSSKLEVVYGVGVAAQVGVLGYKPIKIEELLRSVVFNTSAFNAEQIILHTLPDLLKHSPYVPILKFLRQAGYLPAAVGKDLKNLPPAVQKAMRKVPKDYSLPLKEYITKRKEVRASVQNMLDVETKYGAEKCVVYTRLLDSASIKTDALDEFLRKHFESLWKKPNLRTDLRKLVCLFDCMKHGPNAE